MKTTNNKLLDNTGNPVSHNRPTEKYSYRTFDGEHKTELIPISDAKYIEYLEEQVSDTFGKLVSVEELSKQTISTLEKENQELEQANNLLVEDYNKLKALADKVDLENHSLINEVKYLKDKFDNILHQFQEKSVNELFDLKKQYETKLNQFLKIVEDVIFEHQPRTEDFNDIVYCECGKDDFSYRKHLLQEIKSAIEKGK